MMLEQRTQNVSGATAQTIDEWLKRNSGEGRSHTPYRLQTIVTPAQKAVAVVLTQDAAGVAG